MEYLRDPKQHGFTLVEAIMVMVLVGILSAAVAAFIRWPIRNYVDSAGRAEVTDAADLAMRRLARDLRGSLPNSVRVAGDGHAIEFIPTKGGGRYLAAEDGVADGTTRALDFSGANTIFSVVGPMPGLTGRIIRNSDFVVVYNLGIPPQDAYQLNSGNHNIALISDFAMAGSMLNITLAGNPFSAAGTPTNPAPQPSPTQRFQIVSAPVYYSCSNQSGVLTLMRYTNYGFNPVMSNTPPSGAGVGATVLARGLDSCTGLFSYSATAQRIGLVVISLALRARNDTDASIRLVRQVHVDNAP